MSKKSPSRTVTDDERTLWHRAMAKTKPYRPRATDMATSQWHEPTAAHQKRSGRQKTNAFTPVNGTLLVQPKHEAAPSPNAMPSLEVGKTGGTDGRTAHRLRRGKLSIDMSLDLHGLTLEIAHRRLLGFLSAAQASGAKCVLVITGKGTRTLSGQGRLKSAVPRWLNEPAFRPLVLSIAHAQQKDGGEGALYVLIRKPRSTVT